MPPTVTVLLVAALAIGLAAAFRRAGLRRRALSGVEFVVLGAALGPSGVGLVSYGTVDALQPLLSLALGLSGLLIGLSARQRLGQRDALSAGVASASVVLAIVAVPCWLALTSFPQLVVHEEPLVLALALGAVAAVSAEPILLTVAKEAGSEGVVSGLVVGLSRASAAVAVCVFGVALALSRAQDASTVLGLTVAEWSLASAGVGVACGVLYGLFVGRRDDDERTYLATIGIVIFSSGLAAGMGVSPLFVNAVAGVAAATFSAHARSLHDRIRRLQAPSDVFILVVAGAMWPVPYGGGWLVAAAYLSLRAAALVVAPPLAVRAVDLELRAPRLGRGLLAQGGLAVAIAVNYCQVSPVDGPHVLTAVIAGLVVSDLLARGYARRLLADADEIRHSPLLPPERTS